MARLRLMHWRAEEAAGLFAELRDLGHEVEYAEKLDGGILRQLREAPPAAVVIDLSRLPAQGREVAIYLRGSKATRNVPIIFVDGNSAKVAAIQAQMADAIYTGRAGLGTAIREAILHPVTNPITPPQMMQRYAGRTVAQKLGIAEGVTVAVVDAPRSYAQLLGALPAHVTVQETDEESPAIVLWFVHGPDAYLSALPRLRKLAGRAKLWVLWRKGEAGRRIGVTETFLREQSIAAGLVDYKICSIDAVWSGLLFARKK